MYVYIYIYIYIIVGIINYNYMCTHICVCLCVVLLFIDLSCPYMNRMGEVVSQVNAEFDGQILEFIPSGNICIR